MKSLILLTVVGYFLSCGTALYLKKDIADIFKRQNFDASKSSPLVILGIWPASAFGFGEDKSPEKEPISEIEPEEPEIVIDYLPEQETDDTDEGRDEDSSKDNREQTEDSAGTTTSAPDSSTPAISTPDISTPDISTTDKLTEDDIPQIIIDRLPDDLLNSFNDENITKHLEELAAHNRKRRSTSCTKVGELRIKAYYDDNFANRFPTDAETRIRNILELMQTILTYASLSVNYGGQILDGFKLTVVDVTYLSGRSYSASSDSLTAFASHIQVDNTIHHNMGFSSNNNGPGVVGIAFMGTVCQQTNFAYRSSLVEYYRSEARTATIAAHELGHALGAHHDFELTESPGSSPRYSSDGTSCTGIAAIMDYDYPPDKWSKCSNEDISFLFSNYADQCLSVETSCPVPECGCDRWYGPKYIQWYRRCCTTQAAKTGCTCQHTK